MAKAILALIAGTALTAVVVAVIVAGAGTQVQGSGAGMSLKGYGDKAKTQLMCGTGAPMRKCGEVLLGDAFSIDVLASAIPPEGYTRFQIVLEFSDSVFNLRQQDGFDEVVWPDEGCDEFGRGEETKDPGQYLITCKRTGSENSGHIGVLANIEFVCKQKGVGVIEILGGTSIAKSSFYFRPAIGGNLVFLKTIDSVQVSCLNPTPTPTPTPTNTPT
ncbi:MAG: hypothetical protein J4N26_00885, partial [Chloroflexi bacterium]|nr:hypothetical protein [Chloroflexota bacterium]